MAGTVQSPQRQRQNILNSDGQPHPVENILTVFTLIVGLVSFVLGMIIRNAHTGAAVIVIATATGLVAILVGLYAQMVSATTQPAGADRGRHDRRIRRAGPRPFSRWLRRLTAGTRLGPWRVSEPTST